MPTTTSPLVSVITIFLDAKVFFAQAVESVLAQTYPQWELLLVDDGSTDGSSELARQYAAARPDRVRYLQHTGHGRRGMSASRNAGVRQARGTLVAFLDADDIWLPDKLEVQVALLEAHPTAAMVAGQTRIWYSWAGGDEASKDALRRVSEPPDVLYPPPRLLRQYLTDRALTPATCGVLIRRDAVDRVGGFEERFTGLYEDQAFFLKTYLTLPIYLTSTCTDWYRQHPHSHSAEALRTGRYSVHQPSAALVGLFLWLTRYFVAERVTDRALWRDLARKLARLGLHRVMVGVNRPIKVALAWWYRVKSPLPREEHRGHR
jgi:glycosyltransferase involved in cell wall biosynthesis